MNYSLKVAACIGVEWLIYQDLADLEDCVKSVNPSIDGFESSCFSGCYLTPEIDDAYLAELEESRKDRSNNRRRDGGDTPMVSSAKCGFQ